MEQIYPMIAGVLWAVLMSVVGFVLHRLVRALDALSASVNQIMVDLAVVKSKVGLGQ